MKKAAVYIGLSIIAILFIAGVGVWDISNSNAYSAAIPFIVIEKHDEAYKVITSDQFHVAFSYIFHVFFGLVAYLTFLSYLPLLIGEEKKP